MILSALHLSTCDRRSRESEGYRRFRMNQFNCQPSDTIRLTPDARLRTEALLLDNLTQDCVSI